MHPVGCIGDNPVHNPTRKSIMLKFSIPDCTEFNSAVVSVATPDGDARVYAVWESDALQTDVIRMVHEAIASIGTTDLTITVTTMNA